MNDVILKTDKRLRQMNSIHSGNLNSQAVFKKTGKLRDNLTNTW